MQFQIKQPKLRKKPVPVVKRTDGKIGGKPIESVTSPCSRLGLIRLTDKNPEIALEWYYPLNCGFGAEDFSYGSQVNAWWQCSKNKEHIWRVRILTRCVQGRGCPYCLGTNLRVPVPYERSLAGLYPDLAREFHPTKNGELKAADFLAHSATTVWWQCPKNPTHAWQVDICRRVNERPTCTMCMLEARQSLDKYPEWLAFYDEKKNHGSKPEDVCSGNVAWWRCSVAPDHSWSGTFLPRKKIRCPYCTRRKFAPSTSLASLFPKLALEVHPTRNGDRTAKDIKAYSYEKIWWRCRYNPLHVWDATVDNRTRLGSGCPACWKIRRPILFKKLAAQRALSRYKSDS